MQSPDPCCQECRWFQLIEAASAGGKCRLRNALILDPAWTVCNNFTSENTQSTTLPVADGPIYIDAGAFPDHLQPVHDWEKYIKSEILKRNHPFRSVDSDESI